MPGNGKLMSFLGIGSSRAESTSPSRGRSDAATGRRRGRTDRQNWSRRLLAAETGPEIVAYAADNDKPTTDKNETLLKPTFIDLHVDENRKNHHTAEYDMSNLIVRRGQSFYISVTYNRPYNQADDTVIMEFHTGDNPRPSKHTLNRVSVSKEGVDKGEGDGGERDPTEWEVWQVEVKENVVKYEIISSCTTPISYWNLWIQTVYQRGEDQASRFRYKHDDEIFILFNAWCKDDVVYLEKEEEREEYVMSQQGRVWTGSYSNFAPRPWNFGQFEDPCLVAAMRILDLAGIKDQARGNPVWVSRIISAMVNSNDQDGGILSGNWSGDYSGGTDPGAWNGSVAILEEYVKNKRDVRWAQCWVFSCVTTTVGRALGLPTRTITNFASAHDTDSSMTIDTHWDAVTRKPVKFMDDSIWNFHVWNEAWFKRPDLPTGYDGWQAFDATPQELSEGTMRCGPTPLKAVKEGQIFVGFDTNFVFGEVNGEQATWIIQPNGDMDLIELQPYGVGLHMSTKSVGSNRREDITHLYKYEEGTKEERMAVVKALEHSSRKDLIKKVVDLPNDTKFVFDAQDSLDGDVSAHLTMTNKTDHLRIVEVTISVAAVYYTGVHGDEITQKEETLEIPANGSKNLDLALKASDYINSIAADAAVRFYCYGRVKETGQVFTAYRTASVVKPALDMETSTEKPKVGHSFELTIKFTNPLNVPLTNIILRVDGPGIENNMNVPVKKPLPPGKMMVEKIQLKPKSPGKREIIASFSSRQLTGITGAVLVNVQKP